MHLTKRQLPLILIAVLSFGPLTFAWLMATQGWGLPEHTANQGVLLKPGLRVEQWALLNPDGTPWQTGGRWQLLLVNSGPCESPCQQWLNTLAAIQRTIGRDRDRIGYTLVGSSAPSHTAPAIISHSVPQPTSARIYLADPLGNLVLRYDIDASPKAILKDLKRLLRASQIG